MPFSKRRRPELDPMPAPPVEENPWSSDLGDERSRLLDATGHIAVRREDDSQILSMRAVGPAKKRNRTR